MFSSFPKCQFPNCSYSDAVNDITVYAIVPARELEAIRVLLPLLMPCIYSAPRVLSSLPLKQLWHLPQLFSLQLQLQFRSPLLFLSTLQYLSYWFPYNPSSKFLLELSPLFEVVSTTSSIECGGKSNPARCSWLLTPWSLLTSPAYALLLPCLTLSLCCSQLPPPALHTTLVPLYSLPPVLGLLCQLRFALPGNSILSSQVVPPLWHISWLWR